MKELNIDQAWKLFLEGEELWYYTQEFNEKNMPLMSTISIPNGQMPVDFNNDYTYFVNTEITLIKRLVSRLEACHSVMDSATDDLKEFNLDDMDCYTNLISELSDNEELLNYIKTTNQGG